MVSLVLGAVAAAGSIIGGAVKSHQARVQARREQSELDRLDAENRSYYSRRYYEDATQRADNQAVITRAREALQRNSMAAAGQAAAMGASNATVAAQKEANNNALADATAQVAANAQQYKTHVEDSFRQQDAAIRKGNMDLARYRGEANQAAVDGAVNGLNTLATSYISGDTSLEGGVKPDKFHVGDGSLAPTSVGAQKLSAAEVKVDQQMKDFNNPSNRLAKLLRPQ